MDDVTSFKRKTSKSGIDASVTDDVAPVPPVEPSIYSARPDSGSQPNAGNEEKLAWPPVAEDLKRLYLEQKLSASKIAKVYGLSYASEKTAESTILHHLKKNGITRRDPAAHIKKVTTAMVDNWIVRYQKGESLKQIAGQSVDPVTVYNHLHKRGLQLRDKVEAQIKAVTRYEKRDFLDGGGDKEYLLGFCRGDIHVRLHGRAIRFQTSSTHPAMIELVTSLFAPYGPIRVYPRFSKLTGFEWTVEGELNATFAFLLNERFCAPNCELSRSLAISYLAGLFDAEGCVWLRGDRSFEPRISFTNTDLSLLNWVSNTLTEMGFHSYLGFPNSRGVRQVQMWRIEGVLQLLRILPMRHPEKKAKTRLLLNTQRSWVEVGRAWLGLNAELESDRIDFLRLAVEELKK